MIRKTALLLPVTLLSTALLGGCESFEWEGVSVEEEKVSDTAAPEADPMKTHNDQLMKDDALERK
ncbi:hypothetical protein KJI95_08460 [Shewanella sp. JM162201]|uniref:Secreted protein n=1 Tax=Shewanella jiangmenensis TaxID=2837387 RepID=A0ABS5V275_9GAMM|nr:hypothetical protein [Shewanella jiangmenensis]MBT1444561.1 hypothetical protein [Shewanella jiangmenensis]